MEQESNEAVLAGQNWPGPFIYLMRLYPADRFKIGCVDKKAGLEKRVKDAMTWVPEAHLVKSWPVTEWKWESIARHVMRSSKPVPQAVADYTLTHRSSSAGNEVITGDDEDRLIERAERLFSEFLIVEADEQTQAETKAG